MASVQARASADSLSHLALLLAVALTVAGCELKISGEPDAPHVEDDEGMGANEAPPSDGTCAIHAGDLPIDLQDLWAFLGEEFSFDDLSDAFSGCLVEPTGHHISYVCADRQEVVTNNRSAEHFALLIDVERKIESIIASTDASIEELRQVFSCCERRETRAEFFSGDLDEFYVCQTMDVAFGRPARQMLSRNKLAVVMRRSGFDLDSAVSNELGGEGVDVEGLVYKLDNKETSKSVQLLSGETLDSRDGEEFLTVYYTLKNDRPQRETLSHDRIELLDGGGKVFEPIPAARDSRTALSNGEHNAMLMLLENGDSSQLKDVFAVPEGMAAQGFGVRFRGPTDEYEDRYVLGERRWISRTSETDEETSAADDESPPADEAPAGDVEAPGSDGETPAAP